MPRLGERGHNNSEIHFQSSKMNYFNNSTDDCHFILFNFVCSSNILSIYDPRKPEAVIRKILQKFFYVISDAHKKFVTSVFW